jgi:glycosyltransferase involved in cell wall biosynthesis
VLIGVHYFPPHVGGIERVAFMEANELARRGVEVEVLTSATKDAAGPSGADGRARVVRVHAANPLQRFGVPFPLFWLPSLLIAAWRGVRRCDLAHVHDALYMTSWCVALVCRVLRKPYVVTQHVAVVAHPSAMVNLVQRIVYVTLGRLVWGGADTVFYLNTRVRDSLVEWGVAPDRLRPLVNGVDLEHFRPAANGAEKHALRERFGLPADKPLALFVGRLVPKKGYHRVVAAAAAQSQWCAVMVGAGAQSTSVPNVVWLGERGQDDLSLIYRACDLFVLPSETEGFPLTIQEAMASGLPIVTTRDPGYAMYGLDDDLVRLLDAGTGNFGTAVDELLADPGHRDKMARYSREFAEANFTWRRHVDDLLAGGSP